MESLPADPYNPKTHNRVKLTCTVISTATGTPSFLPGSNFQVLTPSTAFSSKAEPTFSARPFPYQENMQKYLCPNGFWAAQGFAFDFASTIKKKGGCPLRSLQRAGVGMLA